MWMNVRRDQPPKKQSLDVVVRFARIDHRPGPTRNMVVRCAEAGDKPVYDTEARARRAAEAMALIPDVEPHHPYPHRVGDDEHYHLSTARRGGRKG